MIKRILSVGLLLVIAISAQSFSQDAAVQGSGQPAPSANTAPPPSAPPDKNYEFIPIKYLDSAETLTMASQIMDLMGLDGTQLKLFDNNIAINTDEQTSAKIKSLVAMKDRMPKHIIFEASFITVHPSKLKQIGKQIAFSHYDQDADKTHLIDVNTDYGQLGPFSHTVIWSFSQGADLFNLTAGFIVENGIGEVISKPVVRVKENEGASFKSILNVPMITSSQYGQTVTYQQTGITLSIQDAYIVPCENAHFGSGDEKCDSDMIRANIVVTDGSIDDSIPSAFPYTTTTELTSSGLYQNGETFIVASLVKEEESFRVYSVPMLSKLPFLGKFFRSKEQSYDKTETIVLVRPTIEDENSQKFLASRYKNSQDLLSIKLGGRERDSIRIHPFADAPWKGAPEIYDSANICAGASYWALLGDYNDQDITLLGDLFKTIRNRVGMILGQTQEQLALQIKYDKGMDEAVNEVLDEFASKTGKRRPLPGELLVAAAHNGIINEWAYHVYRDRLGMEPKCVKK